MIDGSDVDDVVGTGSANPGAFVVDTVTVDRGPIGGLAVSADGARLLATNYGDDTVSVIDTASGTVVSTVFHADEPFAIAAGPAGTGRAYVTAASMALDAVLAIDVDAAEVIGCYPVAMGISHLVSDPMGSRVYVTRTGSAGVEVLALDATMRPVGATVVSNSPAADAACLRISRDGRRLYVAVRQPAGDAVTVLDRDLNIVDTIKVGLTILDVAVSPDGSKLFVATGGSDGRGTVHVVDSRTHAVGIGFVVDAQLIQLIVSRDGDRAYLVTGAGVVVMCARTNEALGTLGATTAPSCAVESPDGSRLYIAGFDGAVTVASLAHLPAPSASLHEQLALDDAVSRMLQLEPAL
ncbi:YncE family protein [[Mycobacterium] crassicus]|uniref:YncE family protein n=1 Tax=[Mycobacterium] crassicus TaxID=2872309 RepID=A0ABU5XG40_9MYCO|nr:YncE family protein [Mycolicibacter sp. MYC098]MEB3021248.1 YncE family protein [Mycolicibacter sp. MYC098]